MRFLEYRDDKARADLYRNTAVRLVEQQNHLRQARGEKPLDDEGVRQFTSTLRLPIEGDPKGRQVWEAEAETLGKETGPLVTPKQMGEWQTRLVPLNEKDFSAAVDELKAGLSGKSAYGYSLITETRSSGMRIGVRTKSRGSTGDGWRARSRH